MKLKLIFAGLAAIAVFSGFIYFAGQITAPSEFSRESWKEYQDDLDNGIKIKHVSDDTEVSLAYLPDKILFSGQQRNQHEGEQPYQYFRLEISKDGKDLERYFYSNGIAMAQAVHHLSFNFAEKLHVISEHGDTLSPVACQFTRSFGTTPYSSFLYAFSKEELEKFPKFSFALVIPELGVYERFPFTKKDLDKVSNSSLTDN